MDKKNQHVPILKVNLPAVLSLGALLGVCQHQISKIGHQNEKLNLKELMGNTIMGTILYTAANYIGTSIHNYFAIHENKITDLQNDITEIKDIIKENHTEHNQKTNIHAARLEREKTSKPTISI